MLQKKNLLNIRTYFTEIRGNGKKISTPYFSIYFKLQSDQTEPQFNTIISKKVTKLAVKRNRIRRLLNIALRDLLSDINPQIQALIFVYKDFSLLKMPEVKQILIKSFSEAKLISK